MFIYLKSKQNLLLNSKQLLLSINRRLIQSNDSIFSNGSVLFSKSNDIFVNLSLEDWIYHNIDLNNKKILLLWTNKPSIVIGRHQNPWRECYVNRCIHNNIEIVRRNSGGGTVYHDFQNLNISFLSSKKLYNRKNNLIIIKDMLSKKFNIECEISKREDLVLKQTGNKISGTASKLGSTNSYHHCTLLIDVDLNRMKQFIRKESLSIDSKATQSISSQTQNLKSINNKIELKDVVNELSREFFKAENGNIRDFKGILEIIPEEKHFSGIKEIENTFRSWKWIYGKTPRFTVNKSFKAQEINFCITIEVFHGIIEKLTITPFESVFNLEGIQFRKDSVLKKLNEILLLSEKDYNHKKFLCDCILETVEEAL